jgi:hypothetical protein
LLNQEQAGCCQEQQARRSSEAHVEPSWTRWTGLRVRDWVGFHNPAL